MRLTARQQAELAAGKRKLLKVLSSDPNCTAVGFGFRRRAGQLSEEPSIVVSVAKKRPAGYVPRDRLLPSTVDVDGRRLGVDVVQAGRFSLGGPVAARSPEHSGIDSGIDAVTDPIPERIRPLRQGCSLGNSRTGYEATLGCMVIDRISGRPAILTSGHGLGSLAGAGPGDIILQPGVRPQKPEDAIGSLLRFTRLYKDRPNLVDAAVVSVEAATIEDRVARNLMAPIRPVNQVMGINIALATDGSTLFCRMDPVLDALQVDLLGNADDLVCRDIDFDMNVQKVGAATGYTSSFVVAMGVTPVNLRRGPDDPEDFYTFDDLVQVDYGFAEEPDRGAAICRGGSGNVRKFPPSDGNCLALATAQEKTGLPLTADEPVFDRFRDEFLSASPIGRMLTRLFYVNYHTIVARIAAAEPDDAEKDWVAGLYARYRNFLQIVLGAPDTAFTITSRQVHDVNYTLAGLTMGGYLTAAESQAMWALYGMFERTVGMNRRQVTAMMNDTAVYRQVYDILAAVPTVAQLGSFGADA